jgi:hypothetical protein
LTFTLFNNSTVPQVLQNLTATWPGDNYLTGVNFGGNPIWYTTSIGLMSPATICESSDSCIATMQADDNQRTLSPGSKTMELVFSTTLYEGQYSVSMGFDSECVVEAVGNIDN